MQTDLKRLVAYSSVVAPRIRRAGDLRAHRSGGIGRRAADGEPWPVHRRAVPLRGDAVRAHAYSRAAELGGLATRRCRGSPGRSCVMVLSSIGLPGLNNFVGEFLVILGTLSVEPRLRRPGLDRRRAERVYLLWSYQRTWQGRRPSGVGLPGHLRARSRRDPGAGLVVLLVFGVQPNLLLDRMNPSTDRSWRASSSNVDRVSSHPSPTARPPAPGAAWWRQVRRVRASRVDPSRTSPTARRCSAGRRAGGERAVTPIRAGTRRPPAAAGADPAGFAILSLLLAGTSSSANPERDRSWPAHARRASPPPPRRPWCCGMGRAPPRCSAG